MICMVMNMMNRGDSCIMRKQIILFIHGVLVALIFVCLIASLISESFNIPLPIQLLLPILIFVLLMRIGITLEKQDFNNGICPRCGDELESFSADSQGGRGYICRCCNYTTWVSYKCVDKNYKNKSYK